MRAMRQPTIWPRPHALWPLQGKSQLRVQREPTERVIIVIVIEKGKREKEKKKQRQRDEKRERESCEERDI